VKRREVIALFGVAAAWPLAALAQQSEKMRRIGVLSSLAETDVEAQAWDAAFRKRLVELGWIDGRNIRIDYRWGAGSVDRLRLFARELVQLNPDALVTIRPQRCRPRLAQFRLYLRGCPIRLAADLFQAWHIQAVTSLASSILKPQWSESGSH
jgi:hypothetical protein